jgi:flavin-dependent dehydrogenase
MTDFALVGHGRYEEAAAESLRGAPVHARRVLGAGMSVTIGSAAWAMTPSAGRGWIAIGDAALARDPISGDGLVSALRSAADAADVVVRALDGDASAWAAAADVGDRAARRYETRRLDLYRRAAPRWPSSGFWRRFDDPQSQNR